jgi:NADH-quinone oxidoreductase subunit A
MLNHYFPILIFLIFAILLTSAILIGAKMLSRFLKINKPSAAKLSPFECGFGEFEDARSKFDIKFYLLAILFIVFDLEVAFLFPWSVVLTKIGWLGFLAMGVFLLILILGFIVEWKKGALEWE